MTAGHRGTEVSTQGPPVLNLRPATPVAPAARTADLDALAKLNEVHRRHHPHEPDLEARIQNYELAARMQLAAGDVLDLSRESDKTKALYGLDRPETAGYGLRCLMARRLVESGVRFVQVFPPVQPQFQPWDAHKDVKTENEAICAQCDLPSAALIRDLKSRGLLESTLVVWGGEFGRLPTVEQVTARPGRDHNPHGFSIWMAGGGLKPGFDLGDTDEIGYAALDDFKVTHSDVHATILRLVGLDFEKLTYRFNGRDMRLTDVHGHLIKEVLA